MSIGFVTMFAIGGLSGIFMAAGGRPRQRVKIPAMPGTPYPAFSIAPRFDGAFAERSALMGAMIVHRGPLSVEMRKAYGNGACGNGFHASFWQIIYMTDTNPAHSLFVHNFHLLQLRFWMCETPPKDTPESPVMFCCHVVRSSILNLDR